MQMHSMSATDIVESLQVVLSCTQSGGDQRWCVPSTVCLLEASVVTACGDCLPVIGLSAHKQTILVYVAHWIEVIILTSVSTMASIIMRTNFSNVGS